MSCNKKSRQLLVLFVVFLVYYYFQSGSSYIEGNHTLESLENCMCFASSSYNGFFTYGIIYNFVYIFLLQYTFDFSNLNYVVRAGRKKTVKKTLSMAVLCSIEIVMLVEIVSFIINIIVFDVGMVINVQYAIQAGVRIVSMVSALLIYGVVYSIFRTKINSNYITAFLTIVFSLACGEITERLGSGCGFSLGGYSNGILSKKQFLAKEWMMNFALNVFFIILCYVIFSKLYARKDILEAEKARAEN